MTVTYIDALPSDFDIWSCKKKKKKHEVKILFKKNGISFGKKQEMTCLGLKLKTQSIKNLTWNSFVLIWEMARCYGHQSTSLSHLCVVFRCFLNKCKQPQVYILDKPPIYKTECLVSNLGLTDVTVKLLSVGFFILMTPRNDQSVSVSSKCIDQHNYNSIHLH